MLRGKKCLVVGCGISGIGAVTLLDKMGARILFFDGNPEMSIAQLEAKLPQGVKAACYTGELPTSVYETVEVVVLSPGVPTDIPMVNRLREMGASIIGNSILQAYKS